MAQPPKVLFIATVEIHILTFHLPYLKYFSEKGYEVHVACAGNSDIPCCHVKHNIPFERSPFKSDNIRAFLALKTIVDKNKYALIHCHTPVGAVIGRLASIGARKKGTKVLYTAHGFQFYKGGPIRDWIVFYAVERFMARFTDVLITINQEDYDTAIRKKFKAGVIEKVNGVGLESERFQVTRSQAEMAEIKKSIGLGQKDFSLLCVGELSNRKNQTCLLDIFKCLRVDQDLKAPIKLVLVGSGSLSGFLEKKASDLGVSKDVIFLGYRKDIPDLLAVADIAVSASIQEGLPFNILEAMAAGKPVVATDIRGHRDLIQQGVNGFLVKPNDLAAFADAVKRLYKDPSLRYSFGQAGVFMSRDYLLDAVMMRIQEIYNTVAGMKT